jgi:hypothetical protein
MHRSSTTHWTNPCGKLWYVRAGTGGCLTPDVHAKGQSLMQMRDLRTVANKFAHVLVPRNDKTLLRDCMHSVSNVPACRFALLNGRAFFSFLGRGPVGPARAMRHPRLVCTVWCHGDRPLRYG